MFRRRLFPQLATRSPSMRREWIEIAIRTGLTGSSDTSPSIVHEVKMNGPALIVHAGFISHSALQLLVWQVVAPAEGVD